MDFGAQQILPGFALGGLLFLLGVLLGRIGIKRLRAEVARARNANVEADILRKQLSKQHAGTQASSKTLSLFVGKLTEGVGRLNRASLDERDVNLMIADLARAVFDPDQFLLYRTGVDLSKDPHTDTSDSETLTLVEHEGLGTIPPEVASIRVGEGKIGWVAAHRVEMTRKDWLDPTRTEGVRPLPNHTSLRLDLISPIVRHAGDKTRTLGVLCIGRPKAKQDRNAKLMLQTISNLGSVAYSHAVSLSEMKARANFDGLTGLMIKSHFRKELAKKIMETENVVGEPRDLHLRYRPFQELQRYQRPPRRGQPSAGVRQGGAGEPSARRSGLPVRRRGVRHRHARRRRRSGSPCGGAYSGCD